MGTCRCLGVRGAFVSRGVDFLQAFVPTATSKKPTGIVGIAATIPRAPAIPRRSDRWRALEPDGPCYGPVSDQLRACSNSRSQSLHV